MPYEVESKSTKAGAVFIKYGQLQSKGSNRAIHGIGRRIALSPIYEKKGDGTRYATGFNADRCFIKEGQFEEGKLHGFAREICLDGSQYQIGYWTLYELNGYAKTFKNGIVSEGLWVKD